MTSRRETFTEALNGCTQIHLNPHGRGGIDVLFGYMCIHFNLHMLEWNGMEFSYFYSNELQHMWIEMNTCASKQTLRESAMASDESDQCGSHCSTTTRASHALTSLIRG